MQKISPWLCTQGSLCWRHYVFECECCLFENWPEILFILIFPARPGHPLLKQLLSKILSGIFEKKKCYLTVISSLAHNKSGFLFLHQSSPCFRSENFPKYLTSCPCKMLIVNHSLSLTIVVPLKQICIIAYCKGR